MCRGNNTNCLNAYYLHKTKHQPKQNAKQIEYIIHTRTHKWRDSKGGKEANNKNNNKKNVN